jgi:ATP synthase protein I
MTAPTMTASVLPAMRDHREPTLDGARAPRAAGPAPAEPVRGQAARGEMAGMDLGMRVLSYLIGGVLVYGGLGWLGDHYLGTGFLLPIGIVLGAAGGVYVIVRRYGQHPEEATALKGRRYSRSGRRVASSWTSNRKNEESR